MRQCPICGNYFNEVGQICSACYARECSLRAINTAVGEHVVSETATGTLGTSVFAGVVPEVPSTSASVPISGSGSVFDRLNRSQRSVSASGSDSVQAPKPFGTTSPLKTNASDTPMFSISEENPFSAMSQPTLTDTSQRSTSGVFDSLFPKDAAEYKDISAPPHRSAPAPTDEAELTASSSAPVIPTSPKSVFDSSKMDGVASAPTDEAELTVSSSAPVVPTSPKSVFDSSKMDGVASAPTDEAELTVSSSAPVVPTSPKSVFDSSKMDGVAPAPTDEIETEDSNPTDKGFDLSRPNEPIPVKPMVSRFSETDLAFILGDQDLMDAQYAQDEIMDDSMGVDMGESTASVQEDCWNENNMMDDDEAGPSFQNDTTQNPMDTF